MSHRLLYFLLLALLGTTLVACGGRSSRGDDDDDDSAADDDDASDDDDAAPVDADEDGVPADEDCDDGDPNNFPGNEETCDDQQDNNCNTLVDCEDSNCQGSYECLPVQLQHEAVLDVTGFVSCTTAFTSLLERQPEETVADCPPCDAIYAGKLSYSQDSCSELAGLDAPLSTQYGVAFFVGEPGAAIFGLNEDTGAWDEIGDALPGNPAPNWWTLGRTDEIEIALGLTADLETTLRFRVP